MHLFIHIGVHMYMQILVRAHYSYLDVVSDFVHCMCRAWIEGMSPKFASGQS